ncbi:MAG: hypothetical protein HY897_19440 [Deltaproteobacteria bacterium]|nr:hypothetical protein [Deltaproteobacteria bacterium]
MITGFNHNVKYRDRVFHIQTEDSGEKNPLIFTHLFEGGNIIATKKIDYAKIAGKPDFEKQVRRMMEDQHKAMLKALMHGDLDPVIDAHDAALGAAGGGAPAAAAVSGGPFPARESQKPPSREAEAVPRAAAASTAGPARPAAPAKPPVTRPRKGVTLFGESIFSEKTLDEVILKYLLEKDEQKK